MSDHYGRDESEFPDATHKVLQSLSDTDYACYFGSEAECVSFVSIVTGGESGNSQTTNGDTSSMTMPHWNTIRVEALS